MLPTGNSYDQCPHQLEFVTELPLTATAKMRRKALPERERQRPHG